MNSLDRMLSLLEVFTTAAPVWSTESLISYSGCTRSTCYRYIKALQTAGLLTPVAGGGFILGPRVVEMDRQIRTCDPVYNAGGPPMELLSRQTGHAALLCALYSDTVMCVRNVAGADAPDGLFSRGQRRPLFQGAASKIILAHLPAHQLRSLFNRNRKAIAAAGLGADWDAFRSTLRAIRQQGHCMTRGEFQPGVVGIAAPLFNREGQVLGSLGIAMAETALKEEGVDTLAGHVMKAAAEATRRIASFEHGVDRPARAVG